MLRITIHNEAATTRLVIEGKLVGDWVGELEQCWLEAIAAQPPRQIKVEFTDVSFIDEAGRELLSQMAAAGAELIAVDVLIKAIIEETLESLERR